MKCVDCERKPAEKGYDVCFRCRVLSVGTVWRGGGHLYGRDNFSSRTNQEYINEHVGDTTGLAHMGSQEWKGTA